MNTTVLSLFISILCITTFLTGCIQEEPEGKKEELTLEEIATSFMTHLQNNNYLHAYILFNEEMQEALNQDQFTSLWESYVTTYGQCESIQDTRQAQVQGYDVVYMNCSFEKEYFIVFRLVFDSEKHIAGFWQDELISLTSYKAPAYVNQTAFTEMEVTIGMAPWTLPATFSIPNQTGSFPCVILIHGSGPNDRDETIGPNKPFKDLAGGLASQGIAVLRYDKRTLVYADELASEHENFTVQEEVIDDVLYSIDFLQLQSYVPIDSIILLGHSLGGMILPQILTETVSVDKAIMMAAPARPLEDLILNQTNYLYQLDGTIDATEQEALDEIEELVQKIKTMTIAENETLLGMHKPYWAYLHTYDQVETAQTLTIPLLILQGKWDYQVTYEEDYLIWSDTLQQETVTLYSYDTLNHLFLSGDGTPTNTEYMTEGHIPEEVITDIITWINE